MAGVLTVTNPKGVSLSGHAAGIQFTPEQYIYQKAAFTS